MQHQHLPNLVIDAQQRFWRAVYSNDVSECRQLAAAESPWPQSDLPGESLAAVVAELAVQANSLRVLQHQLQLPDGAADAAAALRLPCSGSGSGSGSSSSSQEQHGASAEVDHLVLPRDPAILSRLLTAFAVLPGQEPAALMLLAAGTPPTWELVLLAVERRMPALLEAVLHALPPSEVPPLPAPTTLRVPCPDYRQPPYNSSPALMLLGAHKAEWLDLNELPTSLRLADALAAAGLGPPIFRNVRVVRSIHLPRLLPRRLRMNLRLGHTQQAQAEPDFNPGWEDPCFGARDVCRYVWMAVTQEPWSPLTHHTWPWPLREAVRALLLAAHRQSTQAAAAAAANSESPAVAHSRIDDGQQQVAAAPTGDAATLGSLPAGALMHIIGLAAHPLSAWADLLEF